MSRALVFIRDRLRRRAVIGSILILAGAAGAWPIWSSQFVSQRRAELALKRARTHLGARRFDDARQELRLALRLRPADPAARQELAGMELAVGNWELAFLELQSLTELQPEDSEGWIRLADLMLRARLLDAPEAALDKAIAAAPKGADARALRADVRLRVGRYHGARLDAEVAAGERSKDASAWALLVWSTARSRGAEAGIETARRGLAAAGEDPALMLSMASLLADGGRTGDARQILVEMARARTGSAAAFSAQLALARLALRAGDREGAGKILDDLLALRPMDEEALELRIAMDAADGRLPASFARLDAALKSQASSRALRELRVRLEAARNDPSTAAAWLRELVHRDLGPGRVSSNRLRAEAAPGRDQLAALAREHWPGRLAQMRQALEAQLRQQDWAAAQRTVDAARAAYPSTAFAPFLAGILELARGNVDEAEGHLSESLVAAPRSPMIAATLAKAWSRKKGAAFAGQQLMRLAERDPGFAFARYLAARAFMDARDPIQAEAALTRGLLLQPDSAVPYRHLADHYLEVERAADALSALRRGVDRFPDDVELQTTLAQVSADLGKVDDAIRVYDGLLSRRPDLDVLEYKLAALLASRDDAAGPSPRLLQAVQRLQADQPADPLLLDALGWAWYRAGAADRGRPLLEAAVTSAPEEPGPHFHLGLLYASEKKEELARTQWKAALDSNRPFKERLDAMRLLRDGTARASSPGR